MQLRRESHFCISHARLYYRKLYECQTSQKQSSILTLPKNILVLLHFAKLYGLLRTILIKMWIENNYLNISIHLREGQVFVLKIKSLNFRLSHKLFRKLVYVIFSLILTIESIFYYLAFFMPHNNCAPITQVDAVNAKTKINVQPLFSRPSDDMSRSSFCTISMKSRINEFMLV